MAGERSPRFSECSDEAYAPPINIPQRHLNNLRKASNFAIDIGGSLAKLAYFSNVHSRRRTISTEGNYSGTVDEEYRRSRLHFVKFETKHIQSLAHYIKEVLKDNLEICRGRTIRVTGGGAYKYTDLFENLLGLKIVKEDEMECLIKGCNFLLNNIPDEAFSYSKNTEPSIEFLNGGCEYPYLLVNIGSGVSILRVESADKFERVGGTAMGGGTFWGLGSLLTKARGFDELLELADKGDSTKVDLLVKDIYGGGYDLLGLPADLVASSFGKAARSRKQGPAVEQDLDSDIAKSLLHMISNGIGQIAYLHANVNNCNRIIFGGFFIRGKKSTMHTISYAINYWSKGTMKAIFLRHEGYLGAVGAYMKGTELATGEFGENFAFSDGLKVNEVVNNALQFLELDRLDMPLVPFPFIDLNNYKPDLFNLTLEKDFRHYWLDIFKDGLDRFCRVIRDGESNRECIDQRIDCFKNKFLECLNLLRNNPFAYGNLSVRTLLEVREQFLAEFNFYDPYLKFKQAENEEALAELPKRLEFLKSLPWEQRQIQLIKGILGGNVFDWGSSAVNKINEKRAINFERACEIVQERPWFVDDLDMWIKRLRKKSFKKILIFVDNSGADVILGILPFVEEMLNQRCQVVLAANSNPALNDVTSYELRFIVSRARNISEIIDSSVRDSRLTIVENGVGSPCIDFTRVSQSLKDACKGCDLIVIEGMGRAVHTNYHATFSVESLKLCVVKNKWLCEQFGCPMFGAICKYEVPQVQEDLLLKQ